ncbi:MAG: chemotaxis protein CheD [Magnetococcales bacterium]|nr:chemotaxis protein CheD [Magnetococcales bacterium]
MNGNDAQKLTPNLRGLSHIHLNPAEISISTKPILVSTILGSCVSLTFFHAKTNTAAICHGMLPNAPNHSDQAPEPNQKNCFRYVDCAVNFIIGQLREKHVPLKELHIKMFGGSEMFIQGEKDIVQSEWKESVGQKNIAAAKACIKKSGLTIRATDVGGLRGRKIFFYTDTGEVLLRRLYNGL